MILAAAALAVLFLATASARRHMVVATDTFVQEQAIADQINDAVLRELLSLSVVWSRAAPDVRQELRSAGDDAYAQIRRYLSQDLSPEERLQLERVKEAHQRLEVAAVRVAELLSRGERDAAAAANAEVLTTATQLNRELTGFLGMREADLRAFQARQSAMLDRLYLGEVAFFVLLVLVGFWMERFLQRRVAQPLREISAAADQIGSGNLDVRLSGPYHDEFVGLAGAFERMTSGLRALTAELHERNRELGGALDQLQSAQDELIRSEKMSALGRMTAGLAHELNNPLTSVVGFAQLLSRRLGEREDEATAEVDELVAPLVSEARRSHDLIHSLLRFARRPDQDLDAVPLRSALDLAAELRRFAFDQAGVTLDVESGPDPLVIAERQRLQEVMLNVMNNALDAMKPAGAGTLRVRVEESRGSVGVTFEDDGPGFERPDLVFEPFYTTKPAGEGTGLGLALVHQFMEEFGGAARAENPPEGGARVVLRFRSALGGVSREEASTGGDVSHAVVTPAAAASKRVLVVEDEVHLRELQRRLLGLMGADVLLASSVDQARDLLGRHAVDMIVSDVRMPGGSGVDLYEWVSAQRPSLQNRFLFVTGDTGAPDVMDLAERMPANFLHKPFEMDEYLSRVIAVLEGSS